MIEEQMNRDDVADIYEICLPLTNDMSMVQEVGDTEAKVAGEYGDLGQYWVLPFVFQMMEAGKNLDEIQDILFPKEVQVIQTETFTDRRILAYLNINSETQESEVPAQTKNAGTKKASAPARRTNTRTNTTSAKAREIYARLYTDNSEIRNTDAIGVILDELGESGNQKRWNSVRALVVRFKKEMREG